ncbi:sigma-B regulation protein RsbQ [Algoriphagus ratkowskyi]|uniref:Alpha/beta hydrolase n=1 Tax=Algoriphagus ratkowskyi TaxID=57028 RepID=A0A2W7SZ19_9BACT|nr:alpha/beta hydrolase [Algoriphagus ratkowskyi]PZX56092.1 sigma-B regulation protein RsbQ [Algoriphagus ratkowskyi]TXD77107.1 alpha/beta hydrolase [Algoriphagus ratkowskyi]
MTSILKRNNVNVLGEGSKVLVFAHGFGCDQNAWKHLIPFFSENYKLVLLDYIGAGKSDLASYDSQKYASLEGYVSDLLEVCDALELSNAIFIGHSVSCMVGAIASIKRPEVFEKLVFVGPSPCYINSGDYTGGFDQETIDDLLEVMEEDYITWARSLAPSIMNSKNGDQLTKELTDSFCSIDPGIAKQFARVTFLSDNRKDLPLIPVESLTIQCSDDMIAPLTVGEYIHANTFNNTLTVLNAHGHCPHMSHPTETANIISNFIN